METGGGAGRVIGFLLIVHMLGSGVVNFVMERPLFGGTFLLNAASSSQRIGLAVIVGLITEAAWIVIAITAFPIFFRRSQRMALLLVVLAAVGLALAVVENIGVLSMVSLSEAYAKASEVDREQLRVASVIVIAARDWPHFLARMFGGVLTFVFYSMLYRFAMVPRLLAAFGLIAAVLVVISLTLPIFGQKVIFAMLAPMGVCQLIVSLWLIVKGLRVPLEDQIRPAFA